jgi:hypothetical protein
MKSAVAILLAFLTFASAAQAVVVSPKVLPLIQEALSLVQAKDYKAARAKVNEAETVKSTPDDAIAIKQFKQLIEMCRENGCESHPVGQTAPVPK